MRLRLLVLLSRVVLLLDKNDPTVTDRLEDDWPSNRKGETLMFKSLILLGIGTALPLSLLAADPSNSSWENLGQLRAGQQIQVVEMNLKSREGRFSQLSEEAISFRVEGRAVSVPRGDVLRVSLRGGHKRLRNVLLGMLVGGGVGFAVGAVQDRNHCDDPSSDYCYHKLAGGVVGLGIGAAGGAVLPAGPKILYRATPPQRSGK